MSTMKLYLRANERIFINGAVLKVDRKVSLELLNDATFLMEAHVMQKEGATTPLKQLYFVVQTMLISPVDTEASMKLFKQMIASLLETVSDADLREGIKEVDVEVSNGKAFAALKTIRGLYPLEETLLEAGDDTVVEFGAVKAAEVNGELTGKARNV